MGLRLLLVVGAASAAARTADGDRSRSSLCERFGKLRRELKGEPRGPAGFADTREGWCWDRGEESRAGAEGEAAGCGSFSLLSFASPVGVRDVERGEADRIGLVWAFGELFGNGLDVFCRDAAEEHPSLSAAPRDPPLGFAVDVDDDRSEASGVHFDVAVDEEGYEVLADDNIDLCCCIIRGEFQGEFEDFSSGCATGSCSNFACISEQRIASGTS